MLWKTLRQLKSKDLSKQLKAAEKISASKDKRAVKTLVAILKDDFSPSRQMAANTLGNIGDPQAVEPLIAALRHEDWLTRERATEALGKIGDARAIMPLVTLTADSKVAKKAISALEQILKQSASAITPEDLHAIVNLQDVAQETTKDIFPEGHKPGDPIFQKKVNETVDCSEVKKLAQQELIRRGL